MVTDSLAQGAYDFDALLAQRPRLVRLCAYLAGSADAADDLAQETLITAWQQLPTLRDAAALPSWLDGIARNVCLRWRRRQSRDRTAPLPEAGSTAPELADPFDVAVELERDELAELLDRALALLPPATRAVLVARYVAESSHAEIAARLQLSEGAVAMRLQRGKLALRRALTTDLGAEAAAYGLAAPAADDWQTTRLWCPLCGLHLLRGRPLTADHCFELLCPGCGELPGGMHFSSAAPDLLGGVRSLKAAYTRLCASSDAYLGAAIARGGASCQRCGADVQLRQGLPGAQSPERPHGIGVYCASCGGQFYASLNGLTLMLPATRDFWREHPRMRTLPAREVATAHGAALLTRVESWAGTAALDVVHRADTLQLLGIYPG